MMQNRDEGDKMGEDMREETIDERRETEKKGAEMRAARMEKRAAMLEKWRGEDVSPESK